jgi:prepilin-type N-terminal cleavage/methylation domain-containing protein
MTLVELMIVVIIIGILAAIATVGYRKYIARARLSEANAILAEFAAKEQLYFLDTGQYVPVHKAASAYPSENESAAEFWPVSPGAYFDSARTPHTVYDPGTGKLPDPWRVLGVRPRWHQLFCTYLVNAGCGPPNVNNCKAVPTGIGSTLWGGATPGVPWFYVLAVCNLNGEAGWQDGSPQQPAVTVLALTHDSPAIRTLDETQ